MDGFLNFLADYYLIFLIVGGVLLFALIGFIVLGKKKQQEQNGNTEGDSNQNATIAPPPVVPQTPSVNTPVAPAAPTPMPAQGVPTNPSVPSAAPAPVNTPVNVPMPEEETKSDEPTLIIPDPSSQNNTNQ